MHADDTDLLQGNDVAFVQVQLSRSQLILLVADHLLVQQNFLVFLGQQPLHGGGEERSSGRDAGRQHGQTFGKRRLK